MSGTCTHTGLAPVGELEWGGHFCHLYRTGDDLAETLVPYFKRGLEQNEACLWVATDPYPAERAISELRAAVPDLDTRMKSGQFTIFEHDEWYLRQSRLTSAEVLKGWLDRTQVALDKGYAGLRITGNTAWLSADVWDDFMDYERAVSEAFRRQQIIALCSYSLETCNAEAVLDIVRHHDFALARRKGEWEVVENAATKHAKAELALLNADLEQRIEQRTSDLQDALSHQRLLLDELNHRVKNSLASVQTIVTQTLDRCDSPKEARRIIEGRIQALAKVHSLLSEDKWQGATLASLVDAQLGPFSGRYELTGDPMVLRPRAALGFSLILHELTSNAARHGSLMHPQGRVVVEARINAQKSVLLWNESGGPTVTNPSRKGFGTTLIHLLAEHDLGGNVDLSYEPAGLRARIEVPVAGQIDRPA